MDGLEPGGPCACGIEGIVTALRTSRTGFNNSSERSIARSNVDDGVLQTKKSIQRAFACECGDSSSGLE